MQLPKAVIFDMDGLLMDTEVLANQAVQKASIEVLGIELPHDLIIDMIGLNEADSNAFMAERLGRFIPEKQFAVAFYAHYDALLEQGISVKEGCFSLLDFLENQGIPKAVATSTRTDLAIKKLETAGIDIHFLHIIGGDQISCGKPFPDIYLKAAEYLDANSQDCLALEDSENGVRAAHAAEIKVVCVPDIKPPSEDIKEMVYKVLPSLLYVREYLESYE